MLSDEKNGVEPAALPPSLDQASSYASQPPRAQPASPSAPANAASSSATHLARGASASLVQGGAAGAAATRVKRKAGSVGNIISKFEVQIGQSKPPQPPPQPEAQPDSPDAADPVRVRSLSKSGEGPAISLGGARALLRARLTSESKKAAMLWVEGEQIEPSPEPEPEP